MKDRWIVLLFSAFSFFSAVYFGYIDKTTSMIVFVTASLIFMALANIDKISKIKSKLVELEMKDLKENIDNAYVTIDNINKALHPLILLAVHQLAGATRFSLPISEDKKRELFDKLEDSCRILSLSDKEFGDAYKIFNKINNCNRLIYLINKIKKIESIDSGTIQKLDELENHCLTKDHPESSLKDTIEPISGLITDEISKEIEHYYNHVKNTSNTDKFSNEKSSLVKL